MAREIVTRKPHREVGIVNASWLLKQPVEHESNLEKCFIMVALACPVVTSIVHQPMEMTLVHGPGDIQQYTPDFKVEFFDGSYTIVEVKAAYFVPDNQRKMNAAKRQLVAAGVTYDVFTEAEINANGLSARAILLMRYGRLTFSDHDALECKRLLEQECGGSAQVHELMNKGVNEDLIWNMVARHQLKVPVGLNMSPLETVEANKPQGECHVYFRSWFSHTRR